MRILNLQNTVLVSLLIAGGAALAACGSSNSVRPTDGTAGAGDTTSGGGSDSTAGGAGNTTAGSTSSTAGSTSSTAGSTSSGAGAGSGGAATASVCDGAGSRVLTNTPADAFIDDFETATMNPTTMMADATQAPLSWYAFNDVMPNNSIHILRTPGGAAGTAFSGHYAGTGAITPLMMGFGVGVEVNVGVDMSIQQFCVDASVFTGVSFWAKAGSATNASITAGFVVPSANQVTNGGDCPDSTPALTAKCNNYPQKSITLTTDWQQYEVEWAGLKSATGQTVAGNKIQQILWLAPTSNWDFSLDEVAFYNTTPPAGAVAPPPASGAGGAGSGGSGGAAQ